MSLRQCLCIPVAAGSNFIDGYSYTAMPQGFSLVCAKINRRRIIAKCTLLSDRSCSYGAYAVQGIERPKMEDTYSVAIDPEGTQPSFFGVFDGHGGAAVAEMLKSELWPIYKKQLKGGDLVKATIATYSEVDQISLAQPKGLFGALMERGLGGSRCGATAATAVLQPSEDGKKILVVANVGDARVILCRKGQAIQLTRDHKPDVEDERKRIEAKNPFPKKPLVVNIEGTWRVGGLLGISRAFGDAYLKSSANGVQGGYGLTAEPDVVVETITSEADLLVLATDGLWDKMTNQEVIDFCLSKLKMDKEVDTITKELVNAAQEKGSTDDIAVIIVMLSMGLK